MTDNQPLLALDTSGAAARVALCTRDGRCLAHAERSALRHSSNLLALCDEVLRAAGLRPDALAAIACGSGPGSFTGLRVGLAAAKGLALPWDTPLVLVSSLHALAEDLMTAAHPRSTPASGTGQAAGATSDPENILVVACIDAGKGEVHALGFTPSATDPGRTSALGGPVRLTAPALCDRLRNDMVPAAARALALDPGRTRLVLGGTGVDRHSGVFERAFPDALLLLPSPGPSGPVVARLAWARLERGERDDLAGATPHYGRAPDITTPRRK